MKPSGLNMIDIEAHPQEVWQFLVPVNGETGDRLRDPDYPDKYIKAVAVNVEEGWIKHEALDSGSGAVLHSGGEYKRKVTKDARVALWWADDTPEWVIESFSNKSTEELLLMFSPAKDTKWKHHTSGAIYRVLMITNLPDDERYPRTVVYQNVHNQSVWSRPASDWHRSFTPVGDD